MFRPKAKWKATAQRLDLKSLEHAQSLQHAHDRCQETQHASERCLSSSNWPRAEQAPELVLHPVVIILSPLQPRQDEPALLMTQLLVAVNILVLHLLNSKGSNRKGKNHATIKKEKRQNHARINKAKGNL
jgi:hypothetical protein